MIETFDWSVIGKPKKAACHCSKTERLIPFCGFYLCVWCRTGMDRVPRDFKVTFLSAKLFTRKDV